MYLTAGSSDLNDLPVRASEQSQRYGMNDLETHTKTLLSSEMNYKAAQSARVRGNSQNIVEIHGRPLGRCEEAVRPHVVTANA